MAKEKILIVDDEEDVLELVRFNLDKNGYVTEGAVSGEEALEKAQNGGFDLIVLDLMLPGIDGLEVCKNLKANSKTAATSVIMLTARGEESDVVTGLELGADDYVTKPFSPKVLVARIRRILKRSQMRQSETAKVKAGEISIDPQRHEVFAAGNRIDLTVTEFNILYTLARRRGMVFTRYQIVDAVHGADYAVTDRAVDVQIVSLRKKLGDCGSYIETVRGVGYRFKD